MGIIKEANYQQTTGIWQTFSHRCWSLYTSINPIDFSLKKFVDCDWVYWRGEGRGMKIERNCITITILGELRPLQISLSRQLAHG